MLLGKYSLVTEAEWTVVLQRSQSFAPVAVAQILNLTAV